MALQGIEKTEKDATHQEPKHMNFKYEMYTVEVRLYS